MGNGYWTCPADSHWYLFFERQNGKAQLFITGPLTKATVMAHVEGAEYLIIKFRLGTFMPLFPVRDLLDVYVTLPETTSKSFWLNSTLWQFPDYENADTFVQRLVHHNLILREAIVDAVLQDKVKHLALRSVQRHFLQATGLSYRAIRQIERARRAALLLEQGVSILDTVDQAGYADQPHLTRSLKRFIGQTPTQIMHNRKFE